MAALSRKWSANKRVEYSIENWVQTIDALLHEWKIDLLRIWIPLITGAAMMIGLIGGMEIQGCRDAVPTTAATPTLTTAPTVQSPETLANGTQADDPKPRRESREKPRNGAKRER
jgi:hypothetical protein